MLTSYGDFDFVEDFDRNNLFLNEVYGPYELNQGYLIIEPKDLFPSELKPFDEVRAEIEEELKISAAKTLLPSLIESYLSDLENQENLENFITYSEIDRETSLFPQEVTNKIFSITNTNGNDSITSTLYFDDAYVIQLLGVDDFNGIITLQEIEETKNILTQASGEIERDSFYRVLRDAAKIN